jgi:hypothetical protein
MAEVDNTPQPFQSGFRLVDGSLLNALLSQFLLSTASALVPSTVQTRAGAKAITLGITQIAAANASDAVKLPGSGANANGIPNPNLVFILNDGGQTVQVFPAGANDKIDGGAVGAAVNLSNAFRGVYWCYSDVGGVRLWASGRMAVSS